MNIDEYLSLDELKKENFNIGKKKEEIYSI